MLEAGRHWLLSPPYWDCLRSVLDRNSTPVKLAQNAYPQTLKLGLLTCCAGCVHPVFFFGIHHSNSSQMHWQSQFLFVVRSFSAESLDIARNPEKTFERSQEWRFWKLWTTGLWRGRRAVLRATSEMIGRTKEARRDCHVPHIFLHRFSGLEPYGCMTGTHDSVDWFRPKKGRRNLPTCWAGKRG